MVDGTHTLYGIAGSLYTGKVRAYLRKQGIPFTEVRAGDPSFTADVVPKVGRFIIPVVVTPDGTVLQDGTDILDHFEQSPERKASILPPGPVLQAVSYLFELFGGEGLLRPAMHYRWNFDEHNLAFLQANVFSDVLPSSKDPAQQKATFDYASGRMRSAATAFGVVPETYAKIEETYADFLARFDAHLAEHHYLLGGRPTVGDYGLFNPLFAHLGRDPYPTTLMKEIAPRVFRWTEQMNAPEALHDHNITHTQNDMCADDDVPETLKHLMRYVRDEYLSEIAAHVAHANDWLAARPDIEPGTNGLDNPATRAIGTVEFEWRGIPLKTMVMPYRFYLLQRLTDHVAGCDADAQAAIGSLFKETGLDTLLTLRTSRRVERKNHLEVWGA